MVADDRLIGWLANPSAAPNSEGAMGEKRSLRNFVDSHLRPVQLRGEDLQWPVLIDDLRSDATPL